AWAGGPDPTVTSASGWDARELFLTVGAQVGRLEWTPAVGWGRLAVLPTPLPPGRVGNSESFVPFAWYDTTVLPTGLPVGYQMEAVWAYRDLVNGFRADRLRLHGEFGQPFNYLPIWSVVVPPDGDAPDLLDKRGFYPMDGYLELDAGKWTRHRFGLNGPDGALLWQQTLSEQVWDGTNLVWVDHGMPPSLVLGNPSYSLHLGPTSVVHDAARHTWVFGSARPLFSFDELVVRETDPVAAPKWTSLGSPAANVASLAEPAAVSYVEKGLNKISVFTVGTVHEGVDTNGDDLADCADDECLGGKACLDTNKVCQSGEQVRTFHLYERRYDGKVWGGWLDHGTLVGARPMSDDTYGFALGDVATWIEGGKRKITVVYSAYGVAGTLECTSGACGKLTSRGQPVIGGVASHFVATTSFTSTGAFTYVSFIGRTPTGSVAELYRDTRVAGGKWAFRTLYQATGKPDDSDSDGITDLDEVGLAASDPVVFGCVDPYDGDSDHDGLGDGEEDALGTALCDSDTDGDLSPDGYEVDHTCLDPLIDDAGLDPDGDGLTSGAEYLRWTDPCVSDTDADGVGDGKDNCPRTGPADLTDSDGDGQGDLCDADRDGDACPNGLDVAPDDPAIPTLCPVLSRPDDDVVFQMDDRLDDPRLHDLIDGMIPIAPKEPCPLCDQPMIVSTKFGTETAILDAVLDWADQPELGRYGTLAIPDLDGDGFAEIAVALPDATTSTGLAGAGVVVVVASGGGRMITVEGRFEGQGLGVALDLTEDGQLRLESALSDKVFGAEQEVPLGPTSWDDVVR
ncbi:MAG: thrombospondin type 3 repeat-containing protein, partial [Myxococcota bacterium]